MSSSSESSSRVEPERRLLELELDEKNFEEIDVAMLYIEEARRRAETAAAALRKNGAEQHLVAALEASEQELSDVARRLRQGTFFAVPKEQLSI